MQVLLPITSKRFSVYKMTFSKIALFGEPCTTMMLCSSPIHVFIIYVLFTRSTQPSTLRGTVKWVSALGLSNNKWRCWMRMVAAISGGLAVQVGWLGLTVGGHLGAESAFAKWTGWTRAMALPWWQRHKYYLRYYYYYYYKIFASKSVKNKNLYLTKVIRYFTALLIDVYRCCGDKQTIFVRFHEWPLDNGV